MALTDIQVKNAKADSKPRKLSDEKGLYLYISVAGGKSWRFDYDFFGKRKTLTIGAYPTVGLADARRLRDEAKKKLAEGLDPSLAKKREHLAAKAAAGNTFGVIADEFIEKLETG
ncbi:Arm DNA-binding domain-containing protein [Agrobacterium tumefaciens]|uniref:Arm DNA-binding domain-containing protein n=1 Tax=Agrobacterium tumefaciens TaxID=358 RepID=UPI000A694966|nr:Arm DNA-binding domain-containing protein [Agrobacterium tumefaciens]